MLSTTEHFGKLAVVKIARRDHFQRPIALCRCECGRECYFPLASLRQGDIKGCEKCVRGSRREADLIGQKFGRLTVIKSAETRSCRRKFWLCLCECGRLKEVWHQRLIEADILSCGCTKQPRIKRNGMLASYFGVSRKRTGWISRIRHNGKTIYLGSFKTEEEAAIARNDYIKENRLEHLYAIQKIQ